MGTMRAAGLVTAGVVCSSAAVAHADAPAGADRPNIVLILADDLGFGDLGCYGQRHIRTPNIDRLAAEGMRFTQAYSGSPVCAPSRCSLLTGMHTGHAAIRDNKEVQPEGQAPLPIETVTIARLLRERGYATACVGKWGLGPVGSSGEPGKQGFDYFYGHNCQRAAHEHYTDHVWRNDQRIELDGKSYVPDLMADEAVKWLGENGGRPFFLYFATPLPHVSLQAPEEAVAAYRGKLGRERPFGGTGSYVPCAEPRALYAAMVSRMDEHVGRIMEKLRQMGLDEKTLVLFASDNGASFARVGVESAFFESAGELRGLKEDVYEGGIRVPLIARWSGRVKAGQTSGHVMALWDFFATAAEAAGIEAAVPRESVSFLPTLLGQPQREHEYLYWEFGPKGGQRAIREGKWKAVQVGLKRSADAPVELYDLSSDPGEKRDVAAEHPEIVERLRERMKSARTPSAIPQWNF